MATNSTYEVHTLGQDRVLVCGSFRPQGTSALVDADTAPPPVNRGFSVARTSLGLYTVTFDEPWFDLDSCLVSVREASGNVTVAQGGDYSQANKTLQIKTFQQSGTGLSTGFIPLDITSAREIASNDLQALAAHGGLLATDSDPSIARVNGATDKAVRVIWDTAADTDEIHLPSVPLPPDWSTGTAINVHLLAAMGGATDTPTVDCQIFFGVGDVECGAATAAITGTTVAEYTAAVAAGDVPAHPNFLNLALVPGAHTNDALHLYAAWIEYTRSSNAVLTLADLADDADNRVSFACVFRNSPAGGVAAT